MSRFIVAIVGSSISYAFYFALFCFYAVLIFVFAYLAFLVVGFSLFTMSEKGGFVGGTIVGGYGLLTVIKSDRNVSRS